MGSLSTLSASDSEGSYVPDLVSDSGSEGEDEEMGAEKGRLKKKRDSGASRQKANYSDLRKKARGEQKVCLIPYHFPSFHNYCAEFPS